MNIWIVNHYAIPPSMGGLVRHYYFSKYLQQKGHKVKIFTSSKIHNTDINMIKDRSLYKEEMEEGVEYTFVRSRNYKGNGLDRVSNLADLPFKMWKTMKVFYKKEKPDVVYTSSPDLFVAFFALLFGRKHKIPVVVEIRDLWPESIVKYNGMSRKNPVIWMLYQLEKWIYIKADRLIFTFEGGKEYIKEKGWDKYIDAKKIYHINNGVDIGEFEHNKVKYPLPLEVFNEVGYINVIYAGSIRRVNDVGKLVELAKYLGEHGYGYIRFLVFGDGNEKEALKEYVKKHDITNVYFMGKIDRKYIPYVLSKGDINFMHGATTSILKYGCSLNKLFDYIASKKPIVSDLNVAYDLITLYGLGVSVKTPTVENIAGAIVEMSEKYDEISEKVSERCETVIKQYDYKTLTKKLENILNF